MNAVEFETVAENGFIYIPDEYKDKIDNRKNIRLVVMYDDIPSSSTEDIIKNDELEKLEELFLASDNKIVLTKENAIDTNGMIDDIS